MRFAGRPLDSVEVFCRVRLVIKGGVVVRDDRPRPLREGRESR